MGLLLPHKSKIMVYPDMVTVSPVVEHPASGGGKREVIDGFSDESRYRLFRMMHQLTFEKVTFVTLTYPGVFPTEPKVYKAHLKEYRRRFELLYGAVGAVWRLEFQERGAPHFHVMYLDAPYIDIHDWCWLWKSVCKTYDMAHELLGVDVKLVTGKSEGKLIASYLAKYVGKTDKGERPDGTSKVGRWWGYWNIKPIDPVEIEVRGWEAERIVTELLDSRPSTEKWEPANRTMCTVFGGSMGSGSYGEFVVRTVEEFRRKHNPRGT